ncbi:HAD family hydrolase [Legionella jamestowniensis]|uniref:HAD-superfamily hydrolase n=1 Tax=Legionella jamestowniensis TaxID=455 RepID=A0A0W0UL43_9GAMM|nr:HAD family phosphatase [Legionella jamestowniensis]KTD08533.1 HAD-superfamily hydrolase [Legionella jamestowniensis]SFL52501.1 haloacid dehalogenase superfamily, subfamily IA, variant 3 with third motif having DD or ED/haloacid dehalogenase superfamily, subfamily IA, variant 1 with third motif having Dx(3-4)D or Dx(3-4)E [Legionella jamestowniensis DSM 19215]
MRIDLVIFDNDGVLIDSEIIWHQFCAKEMTRLGYAMTVEQSLRLFSAVSHEKTFADILVNEYGSSDIGLDFSKIGYETETNYSSLLKPVENIQQLLDFLDNKKIKKCVASNGDFDYIKNTLEFTGLKKYFDDESIIGIGEMQRKPEPDVFLQAAHKFAVSPEHCLVIEDHALGIKAAKAAHMKVIGFLGATHAQHIDHYNWLAHAGPMKIANCVRELLEIIKQELESKTS